MWHENLPYLNKYAYVLCGNWHDAEDLVSIAIIKGIEFSQKHLIEIEQPKYFFKKFVKWAYLQSFRKQTMLPIEDFILSTKPEQDAALTVSDLLRDVASLSEKRRPIIHDYLKGDNILLIARKNRHVSEKTVQKYIREFKQGYAA